MNCIYYEREKIEYQKEMRGLLTVDEYRELYCFSLQADIKMISICYKVDLRQIYIEALTLSYKLKLKNPRLRVEYKLKEIELYDHRKYHSRTIDKFKIYNNHREKI